MGSDCYITTTIVAHHNAGVVNRDDGVVKRLVACRGQIILVNRAGMRWWCPCCEWRPIIVPCDDTTMLTPSISLTTRTATIAAIADVALGAHAQS
jgi:hypothetical protein